MDNALISPLISLGQTWPTDGSILQIYVSDKSAALFIKFETCWLKHLQ